MTNNTPAAYFDRAKAISKMILEAQEDLKQLKADATEELIDESMSKNEAKEIREDLAEVFYLARLEAKSELPKSAKKIARRIRMAAECGVQLSFLDDLQNAVTLAAVPEGAALN
jgi:regulator of replication initiation timing